MTRATIHVAKTNLSKLIVKACAGEEVVIYRGSEPVARLVAYEKLSPRRKFGALKGSVAVTDSFFAPLPKGELAGWE